MKKFSSFFIAGLLTACTTNPLQEYPANSIFTLGKERGWETAVMNEKEINILGLLPAELQRSNLHGAGYVADIVNVKIAG